MIIHAYIKVSILFMPFKTISIRPFIGAKNYPESRSFYNDWGFKETVISAEMSLFRLNDLAFYLQDYYVKEWVDNTMLFLEVDDVQTYWSEIQELNLPAKYPSVKLVPIKTLEWGSECFVHDPSNILWHIGEFKK